MTISNETLTEIDDADDTYGLCSVTWSAYFPVTKEEGFKSHIIRQ